MRSHDAIALVAGVNPSCTSNDIEIYFKQSHLVGQYAAQLLTVEPVPLQCL